MIRVIKRVCIAVALVLTLGGSLAIATPAYADDGVLVVVGYAGGPYYEKHIFSSAELNALSSGPYEYATISHGYFLRHGIAYGVPVGTLVSAAGIDPTNLWRFGYGARDNYRPGAMDGYGYESWSWSSLNSARYFYPNVWLYYYRNDSFADRSGIYPEDMAAATAGAQVVPAILTTSSQLKPGWAYDDNFTLAENQAEWNNMPPWDTYSMRLMYGQYGILDLNSDAFIREIEVVYCIFGGTPTITFDESQVSGEIGEDITIMPTLLADDPVIAQYGLQDMQWTTSDLNAAEITKNADGSITIHIVGNGTVQVGASFGESKAGAQFIAVGGFGVKCGTGIGEGVGDGVGDWAGIGTGTGDDGTGTGSGETGTGSGSGTGDDEDDHSGTSLPDGATAAGTLDGDQLGETALDAEASDSVSAALTGADSASGASGERGGGSSGGAWQLNVASYEEETPLQFVSFDDAPAAWTYLLGIGGIFCLGGLRKIGAYQLARDHYQTGNNPKQTRKDRGN
jgi:hypothetical protein